MSRPKTLKVKAAHADRPVPKERMRPTSVAEGRNNMIRGEVVEVPNTRYYRRRVVKGDLVEVGTAAVPMPSVREGARSQVRGLAAAPKAKSSAKSTKTETGKDQ